MTEEEAEIDEKCMRQMYSHLVNANILKPFYHDYKHVWLPSWMHTCMYSEFKRNMVRLTQWRQPLLTLSPLSSH